MPVLHIEHRIADLGTWLQDFASRAPAWEQAGVTAVHVLQAEDDPQYIVELVFFDTADAANKYRTFMREQVWSSSSWLAENPSTIIFHELKNAEATAAAVSRSTAAAERSDRAGKEKKRIAAQLARAIERTPWRIEHRSGPMYELRNDSETPKFYVGITGEGVRFPRTAPRIDGHSSISFQGLDAMDAGTQVDVTWHRRQDQSDKPRRWTGKTPA
ncbi:MAG: hypothetical protein WBR28_03290 [Mycobacterium sp.]